MHSAYFSGACVCVCVDEPQKLNKRQSLEFVNFALIRKSTLRERCPLGTLKVAAVFLFPPEEIEPRAVGKTLTVGGSRAARVAGEHGIKYSELSVTSVRLTGIPLKKIYQTSRHFGGCCQPYSSLVIMSFLPCMFDSADSLMIIGKPHMVSRRESEGEQVIRLMDGAG